MKKRITSWLDKFPCRKSQGYLLAPSNVAAVSAARCVAPRYHGAVLSNGSKGTAGCLDLLDVDQLL